MKPRHPVLRVLSAVPLLGGVAIYIAAIHDTYFWGITKQELELGFFLEFVAIHSVPFIGGFIVFKPENLRGHIFRWTGLLGLLAMYTLFPWFQGGFQGVVLFWIFAIGTYLGPLLSEARLRGLLARWIVNLILFIVVMGVVQWVTDFDGDNFAAAPVRTQFIFLAVLLGCFAAMEIAGIYDWVLKKNPARRAKQKLEPVA